jgi:hypothetical protein
MTVPTMNKLSTVFPIMIDKYEQFIPNIEGMGVPDKINAIIQYLNRIGKLSNDVVTDWNKVMVWVMDEGLNDAVNTKVDDMVAQGTFDDLLNGMFDVINADVTDFKNTVNGQVNVLTSSLSDKVSYPVLSTETSVVDKTQPYGHIKRYGGKCDYNKTTNIGTDDTTALNTAIQNCISNGFTLRLSGLIKITTEISIEQYAGLKIVGDSQRSTMIYQATDNTVIFRLKGQLYDISSLGLGYVNHNHQEIQMLLLLLRTNVIRVVSTSYIYGMPIKRLVFLLKQAETLFFLVRLAILP